jgi:hypothetical protein
LEFGNNWKAKINRRRKMKIKKFVFALAGICLLFFVTGPAMAGPPSAKFAATWTTKLGLASAVIITDANTDTVMVDSNTGYTLATIKVPQGKELLIGVSAEIGLVTDTSVKGKNGGAARAVAGGEAYVTVFAVPRDGGNSVKAAPGQIMLSKRVQELDATLGGVIQSCVVTCGEDATTGEIVCDDIVIADDCEVTDEEIGLLLNTTAAHHFNFLLPDMNQGVYDIKAVFTTGARAEVDICDEGEALCSNDPDGTVTASAVATAVINKPMLTVQQVRAAKDTLHEVEIIEQ